uniref:Uncharacterized protein n=1 Tax=Anopheles merus TaxID=30066 RepID=A0A182VKR3_ANOME
MHFKLHTIAVITLLGLWAVPVPATFNTVQQETVIEHIDVPNRIAWLPEGTDLVLRFLINISNKMIAHYGLALERIKHLRATIQSYPPAYTSIDLFYDNDIQQPIDGDKQKPDLGSGYGKDVFQSALKTVQQFAGKRIPAVSLPGNENGNSSASLLNAFSAASWQNPTAFVAARISFSRMLRNISTSFHLRPYQPP